MTAHPTGARHEYSVSQAPEIAEILAQLRSIIINDLDVRFKEEEVTDDAPLLEGRLALDSIVLYEFITLVEERFGFEFADQNLSTGLFANLRVLANYIHDIKA